MIKYELLLRLHYNMHPDVVAYYKNYTPSHEDDSGFDLPAPEDINVKALKCGSIDFKISAAMMDKESGKYTGYYLYPRSSICKYPLMEANHVGIIDSGYRGEIKGKVRFLPFAYENDYFQIKRNLKLFQICAPDLSPFDVKIVEILPESSRGEGGFGSTGN